MKRKLITIQFIENGLIVLQNKKLTKFYLKSINRYCINNRDDFIEEMSFILDKNKINKNILTDNIRIIVDSSYTQLYIYNIKKIFEELSFNKIEFIDIISILMPKENEMFIDISNESLKIIYKNRIYQINNYFFKYKQILCQHIKNIKKNNNISVIYFYGSYPFTNKFLSNLEKDSKIKTYIYANPDLIPIKLLI